MNLKLPEQPLSWMHTLSQVLQSLISKLPEEIKYPLQARAYFHSLDFCKLICRMVSTVRQSPASNQIFKLPNHKKLLTVPKDVFGNKFRSNTSGCYFVRAERTCNQVDPLQELRILLFVTCVVMDF